MGKIISIANHKGGVAKTTSTASIGSALADRGYKTLLVDLDSQANLTGSLLREEPESTIYGTITEGEALPILPVKDNLYLVPSSLELSAVELSIAMKMDREYILRDILEPIAPEYDYIIIDCPPSLGLLTLNALVASTDLFIPLTAEALPTKGLTMLSNILSMVQKRANTGLKLSGMFLTRYEKSNLSTLIEQNLRATYGDIVFNTKIRKNVSLAEAPLSCSDIFAYAPSSHGAEDYRALTEEIINRTK